jgi:phosphate transport system substrate-binding protein
MTESSSGKAGAKPSSPREYWIWTSLAVFTLLPAWLSCALFLSGVAGINLLNLSDPPEIAIVLFGLVGIALVFALFYAVYTFGKKAILPDTFLSRYGPFIAPILMTLVVWTILCLLGSANPSSSRNPLMWFFLPFFLVLVVAQFAGFTRDGWCLPVIAISSYLLFLGFFILGTWRAKRFKTLENGKVRPLIAFLFVLAMVAFGLSGVQYQSFYQNILHDDPDHPELQFADDISVSIMSFVYSPFPDFPAIGDKTAEAFAKGLKLVEGAELVEGANLVAPRKPPMLRIDSDYPKLDGATSLIPVYAAAARAIYRADDGTRKASVAFSESTPEAYQALIEGRADMIFVPAPSEKQRQDAAEKGIAFTVTPIAREAFVFLVNESNPVTSLTADQIRGIYSGGIDDWRKVGGTPGEIMAFQRKEGSEGQTAMQRYVMRDTPMREPLKRAYYNDMGGRFYRAAVYRNLSGAIGYSFRFYVTETNSFPGVRLLAVNGIAPTIENIRDGSYPFTDEACIVTARPLSENAQKLRDWFLGEEGQQLIADVGYVPIN